ncbi:MAG TPA: mechanosensitive ion channel domain-containing protein, partial [Woeseiaceae bacterium]|nr:mechanosensitive ion channel domain-containing protein [Woeseiaceae bacterium]
MNPVDWLEYEILDNTVLAWGTAIAVLVGAWLVLGITRRITRKRLHVLAEHRKVMALKIAEHAVDQTKSWFLFLVAVFLGSRFLALPPTADSAISTIVAIALLLQMGLWATAAFTTGMQLRREQQLAIDPSTVAAMDVLGFVLRAAIWSFVGLLVLDNLGIEITTLVAGLGIGGVAVALATQNILGDLFASLSIMLDKPFVVGDFLNVNDYLGSV